MKKALVILSGGQDSTLCLAMAVQNPEYQEVTAITFNYGQRHARELECARDVATALSIRHEIVDVGPILKGTSPLTNEAIPLEQYKDYASMDAIIGDRVEKTFVPMRNALFLTLAANRAACIGATHLFTGVCEADNANYPDCRQVFINAQEAAINTALGYGMTNPKYVNIVAPLMSMSKASSVVVFYRKYHYALLALTHTAYDGQYPPVGQDHATLLRAQGFLEAGFPDPLIVRANMEGLMDLPTTSNYMGAHSEARISALQGDIQNLLTYVKGPTV